MEDKVDKSLVALLAHVINEALGGKGLPKLESGEAVLRKCVVERVEH